MKQRAAQRSGVVLATLLAMSSAFAESPVFRRFGLVEGLPSERVFALSQDPRGQMWMATADGLARFDGIEWKVYQHRPDEPDSLPANMLQAVHADAQGRVWVGTESAGLAWLDPSSDAFQRWAGVPELERGDVWAIASEPSGAVWVGGFELGLYRLGPQPGMVQHFRSGDGSGLDADTLLALQAREDAVWFGTDRGLLRWQGTRFERIEGVEAAVGKLPVLDLQLGGGLIWVATPKGVFHGTPDRLALLSGDARVAHSVLPPEPWPGQSGEVWVGRRPGLSWIRDMRIEDLQSPPRTRFGAGSQATFDIMQDREGGIWFASMGDGVRRLPRDWRRFRSWLVAEGNLRVTAPTAVAFDQADGFWVGGADGRVDRIELSGGRVDRGIEADASWPDRLIGALAPDGRGGLWVGHRRGFSHVHATGEVSHHAAQEGPGASPLAGPTGQMLADGGGGFWRVVAGQGLERVDAQGNVVSNWRAADGLEPPDIEQVRIAADDGLWLVGGFGLARIDPEGKLSVQSLSTEVSRIWGVAEGKDGRLWLATPQGIAEAVPGPTGWTLASARMPGPQPSGLFSSANGDVWAASLRGLWRLPGPGGRAIRYGLDDGLPGLEFSSWPMAESADGHLLAVLPDAVVLVEPGRFAARETVVRPEALPVRFVRDDAEMVHRYGDELALRHDDRALAFRARAVSFNSPRDWRFEFLVEDWDADWAPADERGQRVVGALPPGRYAVHARAFDPHGRPHAMPSMKLTVQPPWWGTTAAQWAAALLAGLVLWFGYRLVRRRAEARATAQMFDTQRRWALAASEQKSRFVAHLAHEIRTPMTGLIGMTELLQASDLPPRQAERVAAIRRSGDLLLRLVNETLDMARIEAGKLDLRPCATDLAQLVQDVVALQQGLAASHGCTLECRVESRMDVVVDVDGDRLQQILLNLLSNAIRHAEREPVVLHLEPADAPHTIRIRVVDHGTGISAEEQARLFAPFSQVGASSGGRRGGSGLGLMLCRQLADAMGATLSLRSEPGAGTEVTLSAAWPARASAAPRAPDAAESSARKPPSHAPLAGQRWLLVEDDVEAADAVTAMLEHLGAASAHASHALQAMALLAQDRFNGVIVDIDLPGIDGFELARMVASMHPDLPCHALTANAAPDLAQRCATVGIRRWARKPIDLAGLAALLGEPSGP